MAVLMPIILSCFFLSEISAYTMSKIEGIENEQIIKVDFDAKGNTYAVTRLKQHYHRLYKLSPFNEVLSVINIPFNITDVLVNKKGDTYFRLVVPQYSSLAMIRAGLTNTQIISRMSDTSFYLDKKDNVFYSREKGVYLLRPGSHRPVKIMKLENFAVVSRRLVVSDKLGNTYLQVQRNGIYSLALIKGKDLYSTWKKIRATFILDFKNSEGFIQDLMLDEKDNLWISVVANNTSGLIKKLVNDSLKTVLADVTRSRNKMVQGKRGAYIIAGNSVDTNSSIYFITSRDEVIEIPELKNLSNPFYIIEGVADSEGQAYFYTTRGNLSSSYDAMITIKPGEMKPMPIQLLTPQMLRSVNLDFNDDLWILQANHIYYLKKGENVPAVPSNSTQSCSLYKDISINFVTKKVYVSCSNGLFIVENT